MPLVIPAIVALSAVFLISALIIDNPQWEHLYTVVFIFVGLVFYLVFIRFRDKMPGDFISRAYFIVFLGLHLKLTTGKYFFANAGRFNQKLGFCMDALNNSLQTMLHVVPVDEDQDVKLAKTKSRLYL